MIETDKTSITVYQGLLLLESKILLYVLKILSNLLFFYNSPLLSIYFLIVFLEVLKIEYKKSYISICYHHISLSLTIIRKI